MDFEKKLESMSASDYKKYHESFMQNNHGSSPLHVFFCIFFTVLCTVFASLRLRQCLTARRYLYEYMIIVLPLILVHTTLASYIFHFIVIITAILLDEIFSIVLFVDRRKKEKREEQRVETYDRSRKIYSISLMRGLTYLITVFAILAVDFRDFPRYLAKTEKYGYSLMDTGVGLFVMMSGLVHRDLKNTRLRDIVVGNLKLMSILVFLGTVRYLSVKQLDYQEHVTEYGVHWNFFFTLAVCKLLATFILYFDINHFFSSFILLIAHELILSNGLEDYVFSNASRDTFISANREGLSSCLGYVCLYLFGAHIKKILCEPTRPINIKLFSYSMHTSMFEKELIFITFSQWTLLFYYYGKISRTLANFQYCMFLEAILSTVVFFLHYLEKILKVDKYQLPVPKIIEIANNNGLSYFLVANLLTGAVNLSIRTLAVSTIKTFVILNIYMIVTLLCTVLIKRTGIKI